MQNIKKNHVPYYVDGKLVGLVDLSEKKPRKSLSEIIAARKRAVQGARLVNFF